MGDTMTFDPLQRRNEEYMLGANEGQGAGASRSAPTKMSSAGAYQQESSGPAFGAQQQQQHQPHQRYQFSTEEIRVLKECNRESFYYRCMPIGTALGVGAFYGVRMGYLKPNARWGAGPKMMVGAFLGYFLGKISYQSKCSEKLMQLPNSPLADILRKQKGRLGFQESLSMEPGFVTSSPIVAPAFPSSEFSDREAGVFTDVGDTRPISSFDTVSSSFSDYGRSYDTTQQMLDDDNLPAKRTQSFTTYDDLRKQNREEYEHRVHSQAPVGGGFSSPPRKTPSPPSHESPSAPKMKNAYGDVWDDKAQ